MIRKYALTIQIRVKARMLGEKELTLAVTLPRISKILVPDSSAVKNLPANAEDESSVPESGRSPGKGQ